MKSEFGKGLTICLVKFAEHFMELRHQLELYKEMRTKTKPELFTESKAIILWANGASDHLYDIEVPKQKDWDGIRKKVKILQGLGLNMGHGNGLMMRKKYSIKDVEELIDLTRKIALMIDKKLGLNPELGKW